MIRAFNVWLRPLGASCRVRVEGIKNADWLLKQLNRSSILKSVEPCDAVKGSTFRSFLVTLSPSLSHPAFETALASVPGVRLMTEPE